MVQTRCGACGLEVGIPFFHFKRCALQPAGGDEPNMNGAFRLGSTGPVHLFLNVGAMPAAI